MENHYVGKLICGLGLLVATSGCRTVLEGVYTPFVKVGVLGEEELKQNLDRFDERRAKGMDYPQGNKGAIPDLFVGLVRIGLK